MKFFKRLEVFLKKIISRLEKTKKIAGIAKAISFLWTAFTVVATVVSLIPKYEKLDVDSQELIKQCTKAE